MLTYLCIVCPISIVIVLLIGYHDSKYPPVKGYIFDDVKYWPSNKKGAMFKVKSK